MHWCRKRESVAGARVLSNPDLVAHILSGTIGPSTYFAASLVCRAWHAACRSDETLLRLVALYQGGLTRTLFRSLFALTQQEVESLPHIVRRRPVSGTYYLYGEDAVEQVLAGGGFARWLERIAARPRQRWRSQTMGWELEDRLHRRAVRLVR